MARKRRKLEALQRSYDVDARSAVEDKNRIDKVVEERRALVAELHGRREALSSKIAELRSAGYAGAVCSGDVEQLVSVSRYQRRLTAELEELAIEIEQGEGELERAIERLTAAEEELLAVRVEKKKVERFIEQKDQSERVRDAAVEEVQEDEASQYKRKR